MVIHQVCEAMSDIEKQVNVEIESIKSQEKVSFQMQWQGRFSLNWLSAQSSVFKYAEKVQWSQISLLTKVIVILINMIIL